jgi:hypothetical protein
VREGEAGVSSNLGVARLGGRAPERGKTAAALGRSPARRSGSSDEKPTRWTPGRWERRCIARAWTGETNGARGEINLRPAGGGSVLTGGGGEGAEGWTPRGGRAEERGRERGP